MKKLSLLIIFLLFTSLISAEDQAYIQENSGIYSTNRQNAAEIPEKRHFVQLKFGIGADFEGTAGRTINEYTDDLEFSMLRNQFGVSLGIDFGWIVFNKKEGKGAGNLCLGFGFEMQYWAPTTYLSPEDNITQWKDVNYIYSHYMRVPVTLNLSYEFDVNAGTLKSAGPLFSFGLNNNIFAFSYDSDNENTQKKLDMALNKNLEHYKISGTWMIGLTMVFDNNWILNASIGGDFGSSKGDSYLVLWHYESDDNIQNKYSKILYGHHEFLMFETGYRF